MISLRIIDEENFVKCISLKLTIEQQEHIASNCYSLAEAYAMRNSLSIPIPYAVYFEEDIVGFVMFEYQPFIENNPEFDEAVFYISRMMIDKKYQGKGYGREALQQAIDFMKSYPEKAKAVVLSCSKDNSKAYKLYKTFGFQFTGEVDEDGDEYLRLELQ